MLRNSLVYGSLVIVSIAIGVFIGGGPGGLRSSTAVPELPADVGNITVAPATTIGETEPPTSASTQPDTTAAAPSTTEPPTTEPPATDAPTTTATEVTTTTAAVGEPDEPADTSTTDAPEPTEPDPESTSTTTESPTDDAVPPEQLAVGVANGSRVQGIAGNYAREVRLAGYVDVSTLNADDLALSTVFYQEGFEVAARQLAVDAGFADDAIAPFSESPRLFTDKQFDVVLVLGEELRPPDATGG